MKSHLLVDVEIFDSFIHVATSADKFLKYFQIFFLFHGLFLRAGFLINQVQDTDDFVCGITL